ncbi:hypothetical protein Tco_1295425 [Tanacetum coccineum]
MAGSCSYIGNQHLVADIGGPTSGLRVGSLDDVGCTSVDIGHCSPIWPGFVLFVDLIFMAMKWSWIIKTQGSICYLKKGDVTNIATPSGFMAALSSCSDIMHGIVSTEGCQCFFSTLRTVAIKGHCSSMTSGHKKEQEKVRPSIAEGSSYEVEIPLNSANTKNKHSKFGGLRGESSSRLTINKKEQPKVSSSKDKFLTDEVCSWIQFKLRFCPTKRKQSRINTFRAKKMRKSYGLSNQQNAGSQSFASTNVDTQGVSSMYVDIALHIRHRARARYKCGGAPIPDFQIRLYNCLGARQYDLSTSQTLGVIVFENRADTAMDYDVIIEPIDGFPQRISHLH